MQGKQQKSIILLASLMAAGVITAGLSAQRAGVEIGGVAAHCSTTYLSGGTPAITIKSASISAASGSTPEHCRVLASVATPGNTVDFLVGFPANWNEKFVWTSQGGLAGAPMNLSNSFMQAGYVTGVTDTGHQGSPNAVGGPGRDATFAYDAQKLTDYGHRANYVAVNATKELIAKYYGAPIKRSIFNACSNGGRSAMINAQRYPNQFDGYVVGAPVISWSQVAVDYLLHAGRGFFAKASSFPTAAKLQVVAKAVLAACDADDGARDGVVSNPLACRFDPRKLQCAGADGPDCLTKDQVDAFVVWGSDTRNASGEVVSSRWLFTGVEGEATGTTLYQVGANRAPVDASGAPILSSAQNLGFSLLNTVLADMVRQNHDYDTRTFNVETDMGFLAQVNGVLDATDTNLVAAANRGAKFLFYQGWSDPTLNPLNTVEYYRRLVERYGAKKADTFVRMFFVPGMTHCGGGMSATDTFDTNAVMEKWLDTGIAPEQFNASKVVNGTVTHTKPLCAFPKYARFRLSRNAGDAAVNEAANYACVASGTPWPR